MSVLEVKRDIAQIKHDIAQLSAAEVEEVTQWLTAFRQQQADQEALREGIEDSLAGRVTPLEEWAVHTRARYGITEETQPYSPDELNALP